MGGQRPEDQAGQPDHEQGAGGQGGDEGFLQCNALQHGRLVDQETQPGNGVGKTDAVTGGAEGDGVLPLPAQRGGNRKPLVDPTSPFRGPIRARHSRAAEVHPIPVQVVRLQAGQHDAGRRGFEALCPHANAKTNPMNTGAGRNLEQSPWLPGRVIEIRCRPAGVVARAETWLRIAERRRQCFKPPVDRGGVPARRVFPERIRRQLRVPGCA